MKNPKLLALALLTVMVFAACSKKAEESAPAEDKAPAAKEETEKVAVVYPEGCAKESTITVKSAEAGEVTYDADHSWYLNWGDWGTFSFINWDGFDPQKYSDHEYTAKDVRVSWDLQAVDKTKPTKGTWKAGDDAGNNKINWLNISTIDLAGGVFDKTAQVEITYFGDDYVCGNIKANDSYSSINGDFIAKYHNWTF